MGRVGLRAPTRALRVASRLGPLVDAALGLAALAVFASTLAAALHDASQAWDSWYYHLPFAARLAGVVPREAFVFHAANEARFEGFPLLGERLQGLLWRATGRPEAANLVAFGSLPLFAWFLRRHFRVPLHLSVLSLLAIPLVQTHATSAYVDLPANTAASVAILAAMEAYAVPGRVREGALATAFFAAGIAANMKAQLHPIVAVALGALTLRAFPPLARELRAAPTRLRAAGTLAAIAVAALVVFATPLANLARHGNPYYPLRLALLGHTLPGVEDTYASSPPWLAGAPRPFRFVCSLLEVGIRPLSEERRWTVDQWMPDESNGNRMGGFFHAYVVVALALLAWRVARDRSREAYAVGGGFALLTALVSVMPQSHELRYYLAWMIVLVASNLWLACRPGDARAATRGRLVGVVAAAALAVVISVTRGDYVLPASLRFEALVAAKVDARLLEGVRDGERVCVRREPWNLLWAAPFHPPRRYVVVEAEEAADCAAARPLE